MNQIHYLFNGRLPTEKANGIQVVNTCAALSKYMKTTLYHLSYPLRQLDLDKDVLKFYGVKGNLDLVSVTTIDLLYYAEKYFKILSPLVAFVNGYMSALKLIVVNWHKFEKEDILYVRNFDLLRCLILSKKSCKIVYEAHTFKANDALFLLRNEKHIHKIISVTENLKDKFLQRGLVPAKLGVVHDAVNLDFFENMDSKRLQHINKIITHDNTFVLGYVGRFHTLGMEKGIPELILMFNKLSESYRESLLLLCVGGPLDKIEYYNTLVHPSLPNHKVLFLDRVPTYEVPYYLSICNILYIPWGWNEFSAYYTSPMKLFEYMASNRPIVASNLPSLNEILTKNENCLMHEPGDVEGMLECTKQLIESNEIRQKLAIQARTDVENYSWDNRARNIKQYLFG
jgi:glycosyltransferase involved in cell wall biosynthesis